jgi:hypothetical protein
MGLLITGFFGIVTSFSAPGVSVSSFFRYFVHFGRTYMLLVPSWHGLVGEIALPPSLGFGAVT